ncbi:hypothetical protein J437_LFUL012545 [Ladona fulva]|uniref:SAP domain-containing protein n=1 Tax=Ladona fulva TaxID=123851 RepID=A0A8K0P6Y7_LADFU|nr:hypothetical protein J437_LFUL012545 [Ladona fulva]
MRRNGSNLRALEQLKVKDLKRELEERDLVIGGSKSALQNRLRKALLENNEDPDTTLFELEESISSVMKKLSIMEENARNLEAKIVESPRKFLENSINLEVKINDNTRSLEKKLKEDSQNLEEKFRDEISKETQKLRQEVDSLYAQIEECAGKPLSPTYAACATTVRCGSTIRLQTPTFDGKTPFALYLRAFENVAEAYSWTKEEKASALKGSLGDDAIDLIQNLTGDERKDYDLLVQRLEERYGNRHLEQVYR